MARKGPQLSKMAKMDTGFYPRKVQHAIAI